MTTNQCFGKCPNCGSSDIEHGSTTINQDSTIGYPFICRHCKLAGIEWHRLIYIETEYTEALRVPSTLKYTNEVSISISEAEYMERSEDNQGVCLACGEDAFGVEPDACNYTCESCDEPKVFGLEELLMMGRITIT